MMSKNTIEVQDQKQLTQKETFDFCISSIKHRFFRSLLTLAVVVLAVAFFMYLLTDNMLKDSVKRGVDAEISESRLGTKLLSMMYNKPTSNEFNVMLSQASGNKHQADVIAKVLKMPSTDLEQMLETASLQEKYLHFFRNIRIGQRKVLVGRRTGEDIFLYLTDKANFMSFQKKLQPMGSIKLPGSGFNGFSSFLVQFRTYQATRNEILGQWNETIKELGIRTEQFTKNKTIRVFIAEASTEKLEEWNKLVHSFGFDISKSDLKKLQASMKDELLLEKISAVLNKPEMRKKWRSLYGSNRSKLSEKLEILSSDKVSSLLKDYFPIEQLKRAEKYYKYENKIRDIERMLRFETKSEPGALVSGKNVYLLVLSFIVCMVGIANAMLMSITERFREIATLKCLGATDSFILVQIMIEAALQGLAGGVIGVVLGLLITLIKDTIMFGSRLYRFFPVENVLLAVVASLFAGVLLSVLASIYPSLKAARMAPMEAMRIE